jgi:hypothetical protein
MNNLIKDVWNVFQMVIGCIIIWKVTGNHWLVVGIFGIAAGLYGKMNDIYHKLNEKVK